MALRPCQLPKKLFFFDVETTGLDSSIHDIVSLSFIIETPDMPLHKGTFYVQPFRWDSIDQKALDVNGFTVGQLHEFQLPKDVHFLFTNELSHYVDRFDPSDKFWPVAFNAQFDTGFLSAFFRKVNDPYYGSWFSGHVLDPLPIFRFLSFHNMITPPLIDHKLQTIARHLSLIHDAHDSASDVAVLREIFHWCAEHLSLNGGEND